MPAASTRHHHDEELLAAARGGCPDAISELYGRYRELAIAVAARALAPNRRWLAEDAAQSAFMEVFAALRNGAGPSGSLRPYLVTAVRRHAIRAHQRIGPSVELPAGALADEDRVGAADPTTSAPALDGHDLLRRALEQLPPRQRFVLWATEVEGRTADDIAAALGVGPEAVYALRHRARRGLISAYLEGYLRLADAECREVIDGLAGALDGVGRTPAPGLDRHLDTCAGCRDLLRGVDVAAA